MNVAPEIVTITKAYDSDSHEPDGFFAGPLSVDGLYLIPEIMADHSA